MKSKDNLRKIKYWGASTSAHQVEGGNHNQWSVWELENATELAKKAPQTYRHIKVWDEVKNQAQNPENYVSGVAIDHYNRYEEDFDLVTSLNMNAFRFSIEWSRIEPEEGKWDEEEVEHYRKYLKSLKKRKIEPFVTLWHWTMPVWFVDKGAFEKRTNIKYFTRFVEKICSELGSELKYVIVLNEPNVYSSLSYEEGRWPPQQTNAVKMAYVQSNLIRAHKKSYKIIKSKVHNSEVGISDQASATYTAYGTLFQHLGSWAEELLWNHWFFDRSRLQADFIGLNYYFADRWSGGMRPDNKAIRLNDLGWDMQPDKIENVILDMHERYKKPVIITENGLADFRDQDRRWWIEETLDAIDKAIARGAKVDGYLHWSLLDNFEWADGFWPSFGLVEVDRKTMKRTVRPSAKWFAQQIESIRK